MKRLWQTMARLSHHLGKDWLDYLIILGKVDWLNGRHNLWSLVANSSAVFIVILFDFTNSKTILFIVSPTPSTRPFHGGPCYSATQAVLSYQSVPLMQTHTHLERNCDEHPSLYKMTFFNESFILLTMALIQKWMQLFKNGH